MKIKTKILLLLIISLCVSCNRHVDKQILKEEISDLVVKKYREPMNHDAPCIDLNNNVSIGIYPWGKESDLWEYIEIGDSVYKPSGTLTLKVIKPTGETKEYKYYRE